MPTILVCALYTVIELANDSTNAVNSYIAKKMFDHTIGYYSFSTAMAWIYTVVIIAILLLIFSSDTQGNILPRYLSVIIYVL